MSTSKQIEQAYRLAKERYAALGVDTDKALKQLAGIPISIHCWQGDDVGGFENAGRRAGRRPGRHRQLPRQGPHARTNCARTSRRRSRCIPGTPPLQPARLLRRDGRQESGPRRAQRRAVQELDRLGQGHQDRPGFQPDLLRPSQGRRRLHAHAARTRPSASSGSSTASAAARSARPSARRSARPASPTSGFPTA